MNRAMAAVNRPSPTIPNSLSTFNHWLWACLTTPPSTRKRSWVKTKVPAPVPLSRWDRDCSRASRQRGGRPVLREMSRPAPSPLSVLSVPEMKVCTRSLTQVEPPRLSRKRHEPPPMPATNTSSTAAPAATRSQRGHGTARCTSTITACAPAATSSAARDQRSRVWPWRVRKASSEVALKRQHSRHGPRDGHQARETGETRRGEAEVQDQRQDEHDQAAARQGEEEREAERHGGGLV